MAKQGDKKTVSGLSRRGFLQTVSAGTVAGGLLQTDGTSQLAAAQANVKGPGEVPITLNINGRDLNLTVEPRVTLLDALRNRLDYTGAKKVCDRGACGACTVLMDGKPIYSCSTLAIDAEGSAITTVEGLGTPDNMTPIQQAFVDNDGQQCGYCTPGFIVACTAFLDDHPNASEEEVRLGLGGNLCRCGTYEGIKAAMAAVKTTKGGA